MIRQLMLSLVFMAPVACVAQMDGMAMKKPAVPSTSLALTGLGGRTKTLTLAEFKVLPHVTVSVMNVHSGKQESYSGVPVRELLAMVESPKGDGPRVSGNMQIIVAGATDDFHVAITLCDSNPECRNGQAVVADMEDGEPLKTDGAFKLVLTEDKKPARWARNLASLTVKAVN